MKTPRIIEKEHLKKRVLFRAGKALKEGIIDELSPSSGSVKIAGGWYDNEAGLVVEILPDIKIKPKPTRSSPAA